MRQRAQNVLTRLRAMRNRIDELRELRGRWLYVREILRRDGAIGAGNYEHLLMHVSMHQALETERGWRGRTGRRRRAAMERLETELHQYGEDGRYETELKALLGGEGDLRATEGDGDPPAGGECVLAVLYGWRAQGSAAGRYADHTTIAASEDGYTRLVRGAAWAVEKAGSESAQRVGDDAIQQAACDREIPGDLLAGLWSPQRGSFYHHPTRVVDAVRRLQAGGRGAAMSSERRRSP